jgi:ABC-type polysaccharide/polyol phosphate transport system ATPase subunit
MSDTLVKVENIYNKGAILGFTKKEIDNHLQIDYGTNADQEATK